MRKANPEDVPLLVDLMAEFYAEGGYELNRAVAAAAFSAVIGDRRLGYVWIIQSQGQDVGHVVFTLRYAMEYGGIIACLDDLYVKQPWRNQGYATAALKETQQFCQRAGIRALTVEVGHSKGPAQSAYRKAGFTEAPDRQLLVLPLAAPAHL